MKSILTGLCRSAVSLAGIALLFMALDGIGGVLLPKLFHAPFPGVFEMSETLMVVCVFLPLAWTQARRGYIGMGFFHPRLHLIGRLLLDSLVSLFSLGFYGLMAWQGWLLAARSLTSREYAAGLISFPLYPAKIILAAGLSLMVA